MRRLLLVGAGHAHLHLLRHADALAQVGYRVTLLAPATFRYSGVASATATGASPPGTGTLDVRALTSARPVEHRVATLVDLDRAGRVAVADDGSRLEWDVLALSIGSTVSAADLQVHPSTLRLKPLDGLDVLRELTPGSRVSIVGGGPSALELAGHLSVGGHQVSVLEAGPELGPGLPTGARRWVLELLAERGVAWQTGATVQAIGADAVRSHGAVLARHDTAVLATGLVAPPVITDLGLGDARGVPVRATLQHRDDDDVLATGDCADFLPRRLPRVGVHGVRQGPVLLAGLRARADGRPLPAYRPPRHVLQILDLGGGVGLATRGRWWVGGRWPLRLKSRIDQRWLATYR